MELERTWLVQRLEVPYGERKEPTVQMCLDENGKIIGEGVEARKLIYTYDYMGSAEFEFGTIPAAMERIIGEVDQYIPVSFTIKGKDIEKSSYAKKAYEVPEAVTVYVFAKKDELKETTERIRELFKGKLRLKENTYIGYAFEPDTTRRVKGWLELNNRFFFFIDETMWKHTVKLLTGKLP